MVSFQKTNFMERRKKKKKLFGKLEQRTFG